MLQLPLLASKIETKHLMKTGEKIGGQYEFWPLRRRDWHRARPFIKIR